MSRQKRLQALNKAFRDLTIATLTSAIKGRPDLAAKFLGLPLDKRKEIEAEIETRAERVAEAMCEKLAERGWLVKDPPPDALSRLYRKTLKEFELQ